MLAALGLLNSDPNLISLSSTVTSPPTSFILTVVLISLFTLPIFLGTKNAFRIMWALFAISIIGTVVTVIAFYSTPQSAFIANFNRLSGMNYQQAITDAAIPLGFTVTATLTGSIFTITDFLGFYTSAYFAGEVKQVNRSQLIAMYGSLFVIAIVSMLIYGSVYYSVGPDFLNAISLLSVSGAKSYTLPALPVINFLVVFASPNPFVVIMSGLALITTGLAGATVFVYICVRNLFAWSFDRIMPSGIAALDSKRGTPYVAILVIYLSGVAMAAAYYYTPFFTYYVYATFNFFLAFILVSIGAVVFPYRAKSIFDSSPALVRKKFGGIPMMSILGIVSIIVNAYLAYATFQPAVTPAPSGPPFVQFIAYALVPMTVIAAVVIYAIAYAYRRSRGMNLKLVFSQIPPE